MSKTEIPVAGTPAYWTALRDAFVLIRQWESDETALDDKLTLLRRISAHSVASRIMAAHGCDVLGQIAVLEAMVEPDRDEPEAEADAPPHGYDWCRRGCQPLYGMDCGMCGYQGRGVWSDQTDTVAEYCGYCQARTYQSQDGVCTCCGMDAEDPDAPSSQPASCPRDGDFQDAAARGSSGGVLEHATNAMAVPLPAFCIGMT